MAAAAAGGGAGGGGGDDGGDAACFPLLVLSFLSRTQLGYAARGLAVASPSTQTQVTVTAAPP